MARLLYNRGCRAMERDDLHSAERSLHASIGFAPASAPSWLQLGNVYMNENRADLALGCFRRASELAPESPLPLINVANTLLLLGQWDEGWKMYEHRYASQGFRAVNGLQGGDASKMWRGESLEGKTLLVFNEQGAGDTIMCLRYLSDIDFHATRVIARVPASLVRLARATHVLPLPVVLPSGGTMTYVQRTQIISDSEPLPSHDYLAPFMSLPLRMGARSTDSPYPRYLKTHAYETWHALPGPLAGLRVGIVWQGSHGHANDHRRSIPLDTIAPLFETPGISWVSLQGGPSAKEIAKYPQVRTVPIHDYCDTACVMKSLDLVISVDSSPAHLAGALGVPVWALLPFSPDFRWMLNSETTCWYDSMRLIRQKTRGDWADVIQRVRSQLVALTNQRSAA
jgi:hypothetical protein